MGEHSSREGWQLTLAVAPGHGKDSALLGRLTSRLLRTVGLSVSMAKGHHPSPQLPGRCGQRSLVQIWPGRGISGESSPQNKPPVPTLSWPPHITCPPRNTHTACPHTICAPQKHTHSLSPHRNIHTACPPSLLPLDKPTYPLQYVPPQTSYACVPAPPFTMPPQPYMTLPTTSPLSAVSGQHLAPTLATQPPTHHTPHPPPFPSTHIPHHTPPHPCPGDQRGGAWRVRHLWPSIALGAEGGPHPRLQTMYKGKSKRMIKIFIRNFNKNLNIETLSVFVSRTF